MKICYRTLLVKRTLENVVICLRRRRLERERIGLCGVPDVWGKVHEEDHPQELVISDWFFYKQS